MVDLFGLSPIFGGEKTFAFEGSRSRSAFRLVEKNFEYGDVVGRDAEDVEVSQTGADTENVDDSTVLRGNPPQRAVRWAARSPFPGLAPATTFGPDQTA